MTPEAWFTVGTIALVVVTLVTNRISMDVAMMGGLTVLLVADAFTDGGILPLTDGLKGFAHPAIVMIGALFIVAAGLSETGGMEAVAQKLLGRPKTTAGAQLRMMAPVAIMSGFMNNTPIVAMYLPIINDWSRKLGISPSKLFMPLSFAAILGGKLSLIGTASNVVLMGLYVEWIRTRTAAESDGTATSWLADLGVDPPTSQEQFWAVTSIGLPGLIVGLAVIMLLSRWLLPERRPASQTVLDSRRYQVEMLVEPESPIVGKTIEEAGLRHLPGLYLTQIERGETLLRAVEPDEKLEGGDVLSFAGILESVVDLRKIRGLVPATDQVKKVESKPHARTLVEAVVARNSPLVGRTVRGMNFRTRYNAAIIAVHRNGEMVHRKIGDIQFQPGDTLLLDTHPGFVSAHRNSSLFYLVSKVEGSRPVRHEKAWMALAILALLIGLLVGSKSLAPVTVALICAGLMVLTRCAPGTIARSSVNWQVLIVIGAALGMGEALRYTGAAASIATGLLSVFSDAGPHGILAIVFIVTMLFAQVITANGAAVLMFPIAMSAAETLGINPEPMVITLMIGAGSPFLTPVAYQTNLMVYGAGGYKFLDYARLGLPLTIAIGIVAITLAPIFFPFAG